MEHFLTGPGVAINVGVETPFPRIDAPAHRETPLTVLVQPLHPHNPVPLSNQLWLYNLPYYNINYRVL
jgi:hypothetical protein